MTWIDTVSYDDADGRLKAIYDRIKGPNDHIDNILMAHSLRSHTLEGHMALYKSVLHHPRNTLAKWLLEAVGVYVSMINGCDYCVSHHYEGMRKALGDESKAELLRAAFEDGDPAKACDEHATAALDYAALLTERPNEITARHIEDLRTAGLDDGEILEINQVAAYFSYANRMVLGLGINKEESMVGLSPSSSNTENWSHV